MPTDLTGPSPVFDAGLLVPVSVGTGDELSDASVLGALVAAEVALTRAWATVGIAGEPAARAVSAALGWVGPGAPCRAAGIPAAEIIAGGVAGGNPVIPLVGVLRARAPEDARRWVHRGATSQDILDSALMLVARAAGELLLADLRATEDALAQFARDHAAEVAAARTLTQHAVPTTVGLRASGWLRGVRRARTRLAAILAELPAQLGGAGGTLAAFVEIARIERIELTSAVAGAAAGSADPSASEAVDPAAPAAEDRAAARALMAAYAAELGLAAPEGPWHTVRWPVTELGDALTQSLDALGVIAADVATLSRTEIGELAEGAGGGSSAMPQKQNPAASVLIRSAALRAPGLNATLHTAAALAVDERPDGAWHAEWPTLRELLRLARGAAAQARQLIAGLRVAPAAVQRNLALTGGLIVAERLALVLSPVLGAARVRELVGAAGAGADLATLLRDEPALAGVDVAALLDPTHYTGLAAELVAAAAGPDPAPSDPARPDPARPDPARPAASTPKETP